MGDFGNDSWIDVNTPGTAIMIEGNGAAFDAGGFGEFGVGFFFMRKFVTLEVYDVTFLNSSNNAIGTYSGSTVSLTNCAFRTAYAGHAVYFWSNAIGLFKNCTFVGASPGHNSIAQDTNNPAKVIFSCPDGKFGAPVEMQGNEITVIPPNEIVCSSNQQDN